MVKNLTVTPTASPPDARPPRACGPYNQTVVHVWPPQRAEYGDRCQCGATHLSLKIVKTPQKPG